MLTDSQRVNIVFILLLTAFGPVFVFCGFALGSWLWAHPWPFHTAVHFAFAEWYWAAGSGAILVLLVLIASRVMPKPSQKIAPPLIEEDHIFRAPSR